MMRRFVWVLLACAACDKPGASAQDAAPSASSAVASAQPAPLDTHGKWWAIAQRSKVYTDDRRLDADNAIKMVQSPNREIIVRALDDMASEPATAEGLRAASQIARDAQDRVDDTHNPGAKIAIATAGLIVLHGIVQKACADHPTDMGQLTPLMAAVREMPLPHLEKSDGRTERNILEQEMRTALGDAVMKSLLASAPGPKKSL